MTEKEDKADFLEKFKADLVKKVESTSERMNALLEQAADLIAQAERISDETGVPLEAIVSPLAQTYWPEGGHEKWTKKLEEAGLAPEDEGEVDALLQELGVIDYDYAYPGWEHSAVC